MTYFITQVISLIDIKSRFHSPGPYSQIWYFMLLLFIRPYFGLTAIVSTMVFFEFYERLAQIFVTVFFTTYIHFCYFYENSELCDTCHNRKFIFFGIGQIGRLSQQHKLPLTSSADSITQGGHRWCHTLIAVHRKGSGALPQW